MAVVKRVRHRRKLARPGEITQAAMEAFVESGFTAAKMDDIAERIGIVGPAIYRYFGNKEKLFRAVIRPAIVSNSHVVKEIFEASDEPFDQFASMLLMRAVVMLAESDVLAVASVVIRETRLFPDMTRLWHNDVVLQIISPLTKIIARAQARGEVRGGDPRLYAFSLVGPLIMAALFRAMFSGLINDPVDIEALAAQHAQSVLAGLLTRPALPQAPTTGSPSA